MGEKMIVNIGTSSGTTHKVILEGDSRVSLFGLTLGEEFNGDLIGDDYNGYSFVITGGSDDDGTPMRKDMTGPERKRILLAGGVGYNPKRRGERRRKLVRGSEVQDDIAQLNVKVQKEGKKPLGE